VSKGVERLVGFIGILIGIGLGIWFVLWGLINYIR
jgi:hypothetical protein